MQGKLKVQISLLAVALCVVFGAMLAGCYGSGYTPESAEAEQVIYEPVHYEHYEDACEADDNEEENVPSPPTEPTFEIVYEIKVESRTPGSPPGRFVFSNEPVEVGSTRWGHTKPYFPAGTFVAFISGNDGALRRMGFHASVYCDGHGNPVSLSSINYEMQLTNVMMGFRDYIQIEVHYFEHWYGPVYIGVYHPPWEYLFPPRDESSPPTYLRFELDNKTYTINGEVRELITAPFIDSETGVIMLPAQALADAFGHFFEVMDFGFYGMLTAVFYPFQPNGTFLAHVGWRSQRRPDVYNEMVGDCLFVSVFAALGSTTRNRTTVGYVRFIDDGIYVWESEDAAREWRNWTN